ncbi:7327_t:CDS:2, partial [Acaulospora colombiana]
MEEKTTKNDSSPILSSIFAFGSVPSVNTNISSSLAISTPLLKMNLRIHLNLSERDFIISMDGIKPGKFLEIYNSNEESDVDKHFIVKVDKECIKDKTGSQSYRKLIWIRDEFYCGGSRASVAANHAADHIEFYFKDQYIESAKLFIFVQMSKEMWEFDEDGDLYYEKTVDGFFAELFRRLKENKTNHVISIVLFSRVFYDEREDLMDDPELLDEPSLMKDNEGRWCKDFYKVIVDWETRSDWSTALKELKSELLNYQPNVLLRKKRKDGGVYSVLSGKNSYAFSGNILEAINLALNPFDRHYVDRDLLRTGLSIVVVTPGCGRFEVDKKTLRITTERMVNNGIGLDLVCLSKIPLHTVPLFKFKSLELSKVQQKFYKDLTQKSHGHKSQPPKDPKPEPRDPLDYDEDQSEADYSYYKTPDWVHCTFYPGNQEKQFRPDKFVTRCKMYEIQMMGIMEHEISSILIPYLNDPQSSRDDNFNYDEYDENIFSSNSKTKLKQNGFGSSHSNANFKWYQTMEFDLVSRSPEFTQRNNDDSSQLQSRSYQMEMSRSLPKTFSTMTMCHNPNRQHNNSKISKYQGLSYIESASSNRIEGLPKVHEYYQENIFEGNGQTADEDAPYLTNSNTKPIAININSPYRLQRNLNRNSPSPGGSFDSRTSEKDRMLAKFSPEKFTLSRHRSTLVNPCNPTKISHHNGFDTYLRRWEHVYPRPISMNTMKWAALCTPACLPVTTDYFPPINELGLYDEHAYNMNPEQTEENLLNELIYQRLSQGYQLIVPSNYTVYESKLFGFGTFAKQSTPRSHYLSMGRHVHQLMYDSSSQQVEVKRYVRKIMYDPRPISYSCVVWPKCQEFYEPRTVTFSFPNIDYKWNYVDQLVCGFHDVLLEQDDMIEQLKFWKTRFILIPTENFQTGESPADEE